MARTYKFGLFRRLVNVFAAAGTRLGLTPRSTYLLTTTGRKT